MSDIKGELLKIRQHTNSTKYELARLQVEATLELTEQVKRIADLLDESSIGPQGERILFISAEVTRG